MKVQAAFEVCKSSLHYVHTFIFDLLDKAVKIIVQMLNAGEISDIQTVHMINIGLYLVISSMN